MGIVIVEPGNNDHLHNAIDFHLVKSLMQTEDT